MQLQLKTIKAGQRLGPVNTPNATFSLIHSGHMNRKFSHENLPSNVD